MSKSKTLFLRFIFITILCVICFSCGKKNKYKGDNLCQLILEMNEADGKKRSLMKNPFFEILDSIRVAEGLEGDAYSMLTREEQLAFGKKAKDIANKRYKLYTQKQQDSIMELQIQLDNKNTELLIDIIDKRGYPNKENTTCKSFPGLIFVHSQEKYWDKIRELIEREHTNGNMGENTYKYVLWHINGRKGRPFLN